MAVALNFVYLMRFRALHVGSVIILIGLLAGAGWFYKSGGRLRHLDGPAPGKPLGDGGPANTLEIAAEDAAAPWSRGDGTGCANEIVAAAFDAVGVRVKFRVLPYARAKEMAMSGDIAACLSMSWSPELEGKIVFPDADKPLYVCVPTYVRNVSASVLTSEERAIPPGARIGTVIDYEYPPSVAALGHRGVLLEASSSEEINLRKLAVGHLDFALVNVDQLKTTAFLIDKAGVRGAVTVAFASNAMPSHIGFSTTHPRGPSARSEFNRGFEIIRKSGLLDRIYAKWRG